VFVLVVSSNVYVQKRGEIEKEIKTGNFAPHSLEIYRQDLTKTGPFIERFSHAQPARGFVVNTLYLLFEPTGRYVASHDYDTEFEMSRMQEALFLLKDAGAYTITIDEKMFNEMSRRCGGKLSMSVPVATPVGAAGAGGDASSTSSDAGFSLASRLVVTRFSEQPEFQRHYKPEGKWFYSNGLQEKQVELAIKAVEQGNEPPTEEMTMEFQQELGNSH